MFFLHKNKPKFSGNISTKTDTPVRSVYGQLTKRCGIFENYVCCNYVSCLLDIDVNNVPTFSTQLYKRKNAGSKLQSRLF